MPDLTNKVGRRPPTGAPALRLPRITELLPAYPTTFSDGAIGYVWQMLGNDQYGDCVAVTWATQRRIASWNNSVDVYPTYDQVIEVYKTQNPNFPADDNGMSIQDLLNYLHKTGGPDGVKIVAFAQIDHTNFEELKAATYLGQQLWLGVNVSYVNETEFNAHQPWTVSGQVVGGHSITGTGYTDTVLQIETWGNLGALSESFADGINPGLPGLEEAWLVIWPEQAALLTQAARDAFDAAYARVTGGRHIVWPSDIPPVPAPAPVPVPPQPTPAPEPPPAPTPTPTPPPAPTPTPTPPPWFETLNETLDVLKQLMASIESWLISQVK